MDFLGNLGLNSLVDGAKLVLIGSTIETARRVGQSAWSSFLASFYLTAHFSEDDYPWDWLQYWLQRQPQWRSSREFETTTRTTTVGLGSQNDMIEDEYTEEVDPNDEDTPGKQKMSVVFVPTFDSTIGIYYKKHWLRVRRWKHQHGTEMLSISVVARNNAVLKQLVLEAKKLYEADAEHRVNIYFADAHSSWRWTDSRTKRPLSSIVLNKGVKEMLLDDAKDFLRSEKWYATRGIPFRRGYLLHGVPGSGKTSLIHAMAGALALDIYVVSLSANWINDASLTSLMGRVPARCIVLLEDLDAAFTRSANRDDDSTGVPGGASKGTSELDAENGSSRHLSSLGRTRRDFVPDYNTLSLSGLLNALDGVSAPEGRLLFATTNHLERLDPALTRPGRMDVWVEFKNASQWQAEGLYTNFFSEVEEEMRQQGAAPSAEEVAAMEKEFAFLEEQQRLEVEQAAAAKENGLKVQRVAGETTAGAAGGKDAEASKESFVPKNGSAPSSMAGVEAMVSAIEAKEEQEQVKDFMLTPPPLERPVKTLGPAKIAALAKQFAAAIPDEEHSVASLQGYLLRNKSRPEAAVAEAAAWVQSERDLRVRLKREREERDAKMAIEREKRRKDRELAAERERREQLRRDREEAARIRKEDEEFAAEEKKAAEEKEKAEKEAKEKAEKEKNGEKVEDSKPSEPATTTPATTEPAPASTTPTPETPATPAAEATTPAPTPAATTTATEATPATPAASTEAEPQPAAGTVTPAESDVEVDGQTPGAQSIVLVKPEPATEAAAATTTVSA